MVTVEEYIRLREMPFDNSVELFNIPFMGARIESEFRRRNIKTFGALFDDLNNIIYYKQIGIKAKDLIYNTLFKYLEIEDLMPSKDLLKIYENRHASLNPKLKVILKTIENLEQQKTIYETEQIKNSELYKNLNTYGLNYLSTLPATDFKLNSTKQTFISMCVEKYLNDLAQAMLNNKKSKSEIVRTIQGEMEGYKALVKAKREGTDLKNDLGFLSKMATKIGEVRKYKRNTTTHKEEKEHNPFYNDGETI